MRTATVKYTDSGVEIAAPYSAEFLTELKEVVPYFTRKWNPERKTWSISSGSWVEVALKITKRYFNVVEVGKEKNNHSESAHCTRVHYDPDSAHSILHLLPTAPTELIKAAYRCLAQLYHPDHGSDGEVMKKINVAYSKLTK